MHATLITQPKLRLITSKSAHFPEGNRAAFQALESHLKSLKGRKFYGLVYETDDRMDYHAGLVPDNEIEERRFAALGFPITSTASRKDCDLDPASAAASVARKSCSPLLNQ
jgi:hypothetical protein